MGRRSLAECVEAGVHGAWDIGGELAALPGHEVSTMIHDDRVLKSCFMAQVMWACADSSDEKNIISTSILSGMPHPSLEIKAPELLIPLSLVLHVLEACNDYIFVACPGFDIMLHLIHIADKAKYNDFLCKRVFAFHSPCVNTPSSDTRSNRSSAYRQYMKYSRRPSLSTPTHPLMCCAISMQLRDPKLLL